jgi:two-component system LytT family response regulator
VDLENVLWIQGAENYVQLHTATGRHLVHTTMQSLLERLDPEVFARIHRSIIVNVRHIAQIEAGEQGDYALTLDNGARIQSSRTYGEIIREWISNRP